MRYFLVLIEAVMLCRRVEVSNGDFVSFYSFSEYTLKNLFFRELNPLSAIPRMRILSIPKFGSAKVFTYLT